MRIAIVGAGFSGIATAWFLLQNGRHIIEVFDSAGIGGGTSGLAAGLLHTYAGLHAKKNALGSEGYAATRELLDIASHALERPVYQSTGLLRLALTETIKQDYAACAQHFEDVSWWPAEQCHEAIPSLPLHPGIFIHSALTVQCEDYLKGLWKACQSLGGQFQAQAIHSLDELKHFDAIVLCTGSAAQELLPDVPLPLTKVKGQILELDWPNHVAPLPFPLNTQAYLLMKPDQKSCIAGSTYERHFSHSLPDVDFATNQIMPRAIEMLPALKEARVISCKTGVRASTPDHLPLLKKINPRCYVLAGMGSKGLLYHALFAKRLATLFP